MLVRPPAEADRIQRKRMRHITPGGRQAVPTLFFFNTGGISFSERDLDNLLLAYSVFFS